MDAVPKVVKRRRVTTAEAREKQLVALAVDLAEEQLRKGTASAQVMVHYLKLGTAQANLERQKLQNENDLLKARVANIASSARAEEMFSEAIQAFKAYKGDPVKEEDYE